VAADGDIIRIGSILSAVFTPGTVGNATLWTMTDLR